ncbi:MAG: RNA pseudouridine synthase [Campylobacteraceae bacterium 4484_4]|nr:MAG: RNA pseudouridine synthase [Campylobacteraceae bacterium 4484_4]
MEEKAYKLLAAQEGISNRAAKELIDRGVVYAGGRRVVMARAPMNPKTKFRVEKIIRTRTLYEDDKILAVEKPAFITSEEIAKKRGLKLLHRLDKETSGVLLLIKDEAFGKKAVEAFRKQQVEKIYEAWVEGIVSEPFGIDRPILTIKKRGGAYSKISTDGREARSFVTPLEIEGKKTKVEVRIETGRTHQIRVHLKSEGYPIIGDTPYGGKPHRRVLLHAREIRLLGYAFESPVPEDFRP